MKRILAPVFAAIVLYGCGGQSFTLTGANGQMPGDSVFLFGSDGAVLAAGLIAADSTFTLEGSTGIPDIATLGDRERLRSTRVVLEPGIIRIAHGTKECVVTGTPLNDSLTRLNARLLALRDECFRTTPETPKDEAERLFTCFEATPVEMMRNNTGNILGVYLFSAYAFPSDSNDSTRFATIKSEMEAFTSDMRQHPLMQEMQRKLNTIENTRIGMPYTELVLENAAGETIALSSLIGKGHWVLLDFWATWCPSCTAEIPALKKAYETYREKGFKIYGVSLDNDAKRWIKTATVRGMTWTNVLGTDENKQSDAAIRYGIDILPANFLISPDGIIMAKNLYGDDLTAKLREVIR